MVLAYETWIDIVPRRRNVYEVPADEGSYGALLRQLRRERGWSQDDVADRLTALLYPDGDGEIRQGLISAYERGETKNPGPEMAHALDTIFELEPGTMFSRVKMRGGSALVKRAAPPPGSIVIRPDERDPLYRLFRVFEKKKDDEIEQFVQGFETKEIPRPEPSAEVHEEPEAETGTQ